MTKWTLAVNRKGEPYLGAVAYGDKDCGGASFVFLGFDAGARIYWSSADWGFCSVVMGKEYLGAHLRKEKS